MRHCPKSGAIFLRKEGRVVVPWVVFVQGGVRIPVSKLLTNFLRHFKVCLDRCTPNVFRVISNVDVLNWRLDLSLTGHDIKYIYIYIASKIVNSRDFISKSSTGK